MSKPLRCKLGFHHWHYNLWGDGYRNFPAFYVDSKCYYCGKEAKTLEVSPKNWFMYGENAVWDKHLNPLLKELGLS